MIDGIHKNYAPRQNTVAQKPEAPFDSEPRMYVNNSHVAYLKSRRWYTLLGIVIASAVIAIVIATVTGFAAVTVSPHIIQTTIAGTKNLTKDAPAGIAGFHLVVLPVTKTEKVTDVSMQEVSTKATGTVVLFNENNTAQTLKERTRLESADGKLYFILKDQPFTIPAGSKEKPGSLEVTVEAAEAGESYNQNPTDFVIPGWREAKSPKFKTQYARSKSALTGGSTGMRPVVSADEQTLVHDKLVERIRIEGSELIRRHINDDYLLIDGSIQYSFGDMSVQKREGSESVYDATLSGAIYAYVVSKNEFVHDAVVSANIAVPDATAVYAISDASTAKLTLQSQAQTDPAAQV